MARTVCSIGDEYLPASYNGIPFTAIDATSEHGRRGAEGEFPFGEFTAYADLGRKIRVYTIKGKIEEDAHVLLTAALIAAAELPGPGVLVHPTRGILSVAVRSLKVTDNIEEEAGVTYFDMEFVEGNAWPNGLSLVGTILGFGVATLINASRASFRSRYAPISTLSTRRQQVRDTARAAVGQVRNEYQVAISGTTDVKKYRALADLTEVALDPTLVDSVDITDRAIALGQGAIAQEVSGQQKFDAFRRLANLNARQSGLAPALGGDMEDAVYSNMRIIAAAYMAQGAAEITFSKSTDVYAAIDQISAILDDEAALARDRCDNELYLEIVKFSTQVKADLYAKAYETPAFISYDFSAGVHPLVAAYAIFGDAKRHREIEQTNLITQTGQVQSPVAATVMF